MSDMRQQVTEVLHTLFDESVVTEIVEDEAFWVLMLRVDDYCECTGKTPTDAFAAIGPSALMFAASGDCNPMAYLSAKIRDLQDPYDVP